MSFNLLTSAALLWLQLGSQQALVCEVNQGVACLTSLSESVRAQLPASEKKMLIALGRQGAMALPVNDASVSGIILINSRAIPEHQSALWAGNYYQLPLKQQRTLTLWHEQGHLSLRQLQGSILPHEITAYQHEWLADCYLIWRVAREYNSLELAWQQYHRRNLAVMDNVDNISHWSVPVMSQVLAQYSAAEIAEFDSFADFISVVYPKLKQFDDAAIGEFSSLLHRTFASSALQSLPDYIFWRKTSLKNFLMPTLKVMMGAPGALVWSKKNLM